MDEDYIDIESEEVDLHVQQELVEGVSVSSSLRVQDSRAWN